MLSRRLTLIVVAAAVAAASLVTLPASASHCDGSYDNLPGGFYLDVRHLPSEEDPLFYSIWIFQETNGEAGLQRGGSHISGIPGIDDDVECGPNPTGDAVVF